MDSTFHSGTDLRHLAQVQGIEGQFSSPHFQKREYWQAFAREQKREIEKNLRKLKPGFKRHGIKGVMPYLPG